MNLFLSMKAISKSRTIVIALAFMLATAQLAPHLAASSMDASVVQAETQDRLLAKNVTAGTIELENAGVLQLADDYKVEQQINGKIFAKSLHEAMIGANNVRVQLNGDNEVSKIILDGHTLVETMRVGIRKNIADITDYSQFNHTTLSFKAVNGYTIADKKAGVEIPVASGVLATFTLEDGKIAVSVPSENTYTTTNRLYLTSDSSDSLIQAMSFTRAQGNPSYRGTLEVSLNADHTAMKLINEVTVEQYLYQVVPSEMPASFGLEALRAQAIAARTYALTDYYSNRFADRGIHIDDSTLSQVFNNSAENQLTTQAVNDTAGKIMKSGEELVDARFYSTSGGYGASKHEVWSDSDTQQFPGTPLPYLTARSYTYDPQDNTTIMEIDTSDEDEINAFYKNLGLLGYDSDSLYFRWKVSLTKTELQNTINKNIKMRYDADPNFILTKTEDGSFKSLPIPADGIGEFINMYAAARGAGGNLTELVVEGANGTYKIIKEFNIRFTIRPNKTDTQSTEDILAYRAKGGSSVYDNSPLKNPSILYSAFLTFDIAKDANEVVTEVTFYGGGNGHGVGMSQYGASMLGGQGWNYSQILNSYYANMRIVDMNEPVITGIALTMPDSLEEGSTANAAVTAVYSDETETDVTSQAAFSSSDSSVIAVDSTGKLTAVKEGSAVITAEFMGRTATAEMNVDPLTAPTPSTEVPTPTPSDVSTPTPTPTPTSTVTPGVPVQTPAPTSIVDILKAAKGGKAVIDASKDGNVKLPANAGELLGNSGLVELKFANVVITIPSSVLAQLQSAMTQPQGAAEIIVGVKPLSGDEAAQLLSALNQKKNTDIRLASELFDFTLVIQSGDRVVTLERFNAPIQVQMNVKADANKKRTSVFRVKDDGTVERMGGSWNNEGTLLTAELNHFSKYAALEINKTFEDMKGHWAETAVSDLAALSIVQGVSDSKYAPEQSVSRAEFSALLVRALGLTAQDSSPFTDIPSNAWYAEDVAAAYEAGLVLGTSEDRFSPNAKLSREQMAVMIERAWELMWQTSLPSASGQPFADEDQISDWAKSAVYSLVQEGLLKGKLNNKFEPKALASRAEVAQLLHNLLNS